MRQSQTLPPLYVKVGFGGLAGITTTTIVHPLDFLKVRMQISKNHHSSFHTALKILTKEGPLAFYQGLEAALFRQATYTTTRIGAFYWFYDNYVYKYGMPTLVGQMYVSVQAGVVGGVVGTPSELLLVRMMTNRQGLANVNHPRYKNSIDALFRIYREEGALAFWRGGSLTMTRCIMMTACQIGTFTYIHERLQAKKIKGPNLIMIPTIIASILTSVTSLPVDIVKTRYQVHQGELKLVNVLMDIIQRDGVFYLWHGYFPYWFRILIQTGITFQLLDCMNNAYITYYRPPE